MRSFLRKHAPAPVWAALSRVRGFADYAFRSSLSAMFRGTIDMLRALRFLPRAHNQPGSILVVHLTSHLGDTVLLMPLLEALRANHPGARIEVAVEAAAAPLLRQMTEIDALHALPLTTEPPITVWQSVRRVAEICVAYWRSMRSCAPEICLLPRWDNDQYRSQVFAYLVGSRRRIGYTWNSLPGVRRAPYRDKFLTEVLGGGNSLHESDRFLSIAARSGLLSETAATSSRRALPSLQRIARTQNWEDLSRRAGIDSRRPVAVIAPGASVPRKLWPVSLWAQLCHLLSAQGFDLVLLSGPSDVGVARELHAAIEGRALLLAARTNLLESTAVIAKAAVFVGNDSGPGHLAGALGVPTVVLFGAAPTCHPDDPAAPTRLHPLGPFVAICAPARSMPPCASPCHATEAHCITLIQPEDVLETVHRVVRQASMSLHSKAPEHAPDPSGMLYAR